MSAIRVTSPTDLLALVPFRLGYQPCQSLVLISLRGPQVGLMVRMDLSLFAVPEQANEQLEMVSARCLGDGTCWLWAVLYCDEDLAPQTSLPGTVARALQCVSESAVSPERVWIVGPQQFFELGCTKECCQPCGQDVSVLAARPICTEMIVAGNQVLPAREAFGQVERVDRDRRRNATRAADRWRMRADDGLVWREMSLRLWTQATELAAPKLSPSEYGKLRAAFEDPVVRNGVMVSLVPQLRRKLVAVAGGDENVFLQAVRAIFDLSSVVLPDREHLHRCDQVLTGLIAHVPPATSGPMWALRAIIYWWLGDGSRAAIAAQLARKHDAGSKIAQHIETLLAHGLGPAWVNGED